MTFLNFDNLKNKSSGKKYGNKFMHNVQRAIAAVLCMAMTAQLGVAGAAVSGEQVVNSFTATQTGQAIINNMKYTDITIAAYDLKDAVYQNGALGLFLSPGSTKFSPNSSVSKEMALYLAYMAANRALDINTQGCDRRHDAGAGRGAAGLSTKSAGAAQCADLNPKEERP